ncbi:hypothetical protein [Cardinium endosymbiont of Sogatella furcifera]|uniref:hypothetical protein n=1 Tax=Cardinium endosymbiont of Sogatella furcifera TaxID=650378 RepID=UPI0013B35FA5|nr:hypothetical protein [Cardinium endosymbiont of Sogatella furcifera]
MQSIPVPQASTSESGSRPKSRTESKPIIVYLHGGGADRHEVNPFIKKLGEEEFLYISLTCREGAFKAMHIPMETQVKACAKEILKKLKEHYPMFTEQQLQTLPIHIIGNSQGGVVACLLGANHKNKLNIKKIICFHSCLSGMDLMSNDGADIRTFFNKSREVFGHTTQWQDKFKIYAMTKILFGTSKIANFLFPAISNLHYLEDVKNFLRDSTHHIPILIVAGVVDLMERIDPGIVNPNRNQVHNLVKEYAKIITKKEGTAEQKDRAHDTMLSLKNQLGRTDSYDSLVECIPENDPNFLTACLSVYPENVKLYIADKEFHLLNDDNILIPSRCILNHTTLSENTVETIRSFLLQPS